MEESAAGSILAGFLVVLAALWMMWGAAWLRRVELREHVQSVVTALGLEFRPEGLGASLRAHGRVDGRHVEVRWRLGLDGRVRAAARRAGKRRWTAVVPCELREALTRLP